MNESRAAETGSLVLSYLGLRKAVGIIGILLPFVLLVGKLLIDGPGLPVSISAYYYTDMRNVFVGSVCATAVFLISYRYGPRDNRAGILAGVMSTVVALFPTAPPDPTPAQAVIGTVHLVCAGIFFLTLAYFSLFLFTRTDPTRQPTRRKLLRNVVYRVCGVLIVVSLVLAVVADNVLGPALIAALNPVFWLEAVANVAFGVSWLVKGQAILRDV